MGLFDFLRKKVSKKSKEEKNKYVVGLSKSKKNFIDKLKQLSQRRTKIDDEYFEELEEILIEADVGVKLVLEVVEETKKEVKEKGISQPSDINEILIDKMFTSYATQGETIINDIQFKEHGPTVLLVVGVNGVGKTTTIAKLAHRYINQGKKVLLGAADTFRAAAIEQIEVWVDRAGVDILKRPEGSDPASVVFDASKKAKEENYDILIVDTAGRLHTKKNLMDELNKIQRIIDKELADCSQEILIVLDGTTGQNALIQAKEFSEVTKITGIVLTKLDGTAKGGVVIGICNELKIPVKYIGVGEKIDDLQKFSSEDFIKAILD